MYSVDAKLWTTERLTTVLSNPGSDNISTGVPLLAPGGGKFVVPFSAIDLFRDMFWKCEGLFTPDTLTTDSTGQVLSSKQRELSTLTCNQASLYRYRAKAVNGVRDCSRCKRDRYCVECRGFDYHKEKVYGVKVSCLVDNVLISKEKNKMTYSLKPGKAGWFLVEFFGDKSRVYLQPHGNAKKRTRFTRTDASTKVEMTRLRDLGVKPKETQRILRAQSNAQEGKFPSNSNRSRKPQHLSTSSDDVQVEESDWHHDSWLWLMRRKTNQRESNRLKIRGVFDMAAGFGCLIASDESLALGSLIVGNDGPYGLSSFEVGADPKMGDEFFLVEITTKNPFLEKHPTWVIAIFLYFRLLSPMYDTMFTALFSEPNAKLLQRGRWGFTDGEYALYTQLLRHLPLAWHALDENHFESALLDHIRYKLKLPLEKSRVQSDIREIKKCRDLSAAQKLLIEKVKEWHVDIRRHFLNTYKDDVLLQTQTIAGCHQAGLVFPNGKVGGPQTQTNEATHSAIDRRLARLEVVRPELSVLQRYVVASEQVLDGQLETLNMVRARSDIDEKLCPEYNHLYLSSSEAEKLRNLPVYVHIIN